MVKITNKFGDVKTGKQHTVVYQGHYGNQTRRMLKDKKDEHTRGQLEQRERFKTGINFAKGLTKAQKDFIKSYMAEAGIRSPDGLPTTWYSFMKKIAMTRPKVEMETEAGSGFDAPYGSWGYRKTITLNNQTGGTLSDHQTLITLTTENFSYANCKADGSDLRFSRIDKITPLSYSIKDWNYNGTSEIWVKVDNIPTGENICLYTYYGNSQATTESNADNTFMFFDDFTEAIDWVNKWQSTQQSLYSVSDGNLILNAASPKTKCINSKINFNDYIIEVRSKVIGSSPCEFHLDMEESIATITINERCAIRLSDSLVAFINGIHAQTGAGVSNTWYRSIIKVPATGTAGAYIYADDGETLIISKTGTPGFRTAYIALAQPNNNTGYVDWILVRKYASPDPTSDLGSEEEGGDPTALKAFTIHHPAIKSYEILDNGPKEENLSDLEDHISTVITRKNLDLAASKIKVKTLANQEYEFTVK
jgi:hypothetical protein